jgi:16S rRNA (guanine966-N2)-methyltransferase
MRITGGEHRSRSLTAPRGDATRPTSDRVREALFAILGSGASFRGIQVLDLYAGTGALAFEALSRGAARATLVEPARPAVQAIEANAKGLGVLGRVRVVPVTVERAVSSLRGAPPFDLVFADPPYAQVTTGEAARALGALLVPGALAPGARVVLEHGKGDGPPDLAHLLLTDSRRYGDTVVSFYKPRATDEP